MVSLRSYKIQLSLAACNSKTKMNFQKMALFTQNALYLVHTVFGGRSFCGFVIVLIAIGNGYISSLS